MARIAVDVPLADLDRPFDYLAPQRLAAAAIPGCRVRVAVRGPADGRLPAGTGGRQRSSGRLAYLERVVSPEPARARRSRRSPGRSPTAAPAPWPTCSGWRSRRVTPVPRPQRRTPPARGSLAGTGDGQPPGLPADAGARGSWPVSAPASAPGRPRGRGRVTRPGRRSSPRSRRGGRRVRVWSALPGPLWPEEIATAAAAAGSAGGHAHRGAGRPGPEPHRRRAGPRARAGPGHACLRPGSGPPSATGAGCPWPTGRYGWWPVPGPPCSPRSATSAWSSSGTTGTTCTPSRVPPIPTRGRSSRCGRTGPAWRLRRVARTAEAARLIGTGWAAAITADRPTVRSCAPQVRAAGADAELARDEAARSARMPSLALRMARAGLAHGPVLVQVPRRGYVTAVACESCRAPARCPACAGRSPWRGTAARPAAGGAGGPIQAGGARPAGIPASVPW